MSDIRPKLWVILGPTASGKTAAAIQLAQKIDGAVISADSRQVYTGLDIGTAKPRFDGKAAPTREPQRLLMPGTVDGIVHYLINIRQPDEEFSLAEWQAAAYQAIDAVGARQMAPIMTGGTMLYIDSIVQAYDIPAVPRNEQRRAELAEMKVAQLYKRLRELDAKAAEFIPPGHARRIIRALEVIEATGRPFSEIRKKGKCRYKVQIYGLFNGWDVLKNNIAKRAQQMLDEGLEQEKQELIIKYGADLPLLKTINYREVPDKAAMVRSNLRYARRQMAWWRKREDIEWYQTADEMMGSLMKKNSNRETA